MQEINLQLTSSSSIIDLLNCDKQNTSKITIHKYGDNQNEISVLGNDEISNNFIGSLINYENISINRNNKQKYLCLCEKDSCLQCKEGIEGIIQTDTKITKDPGYDVKIRVFSDVEIPMNLFTNTHDVFVDYSYYVNLTNVKTVFQNIEKGLKIENLIFENGTNLLLKPRDRILNIWMREIEQGPYFTIDIDEYLKLVVPNIENEQVSSSRLHVTGKGELNAFDYPIGRIRSSETIKVMKGIYIICGKIKGSSMCSYESEYKTIDEFTNFENDFDSYSKIMVFLNSFENDIDVRMNFLKGQPIEFVRISNSKSLLEDEKQIKLRFLSTNELTSKSDSTINISNSFGRASLKSSDSDLFVVGFDDMITIKQEGEINNDLNKIVILTFNDEAIINIDESVDLNKQKMKIETDNKSVSIKIIVNKNDVDDDKLNEMFEFNPEKVTLSEIIINNQNSTPKPKKKNLSNGAIAGIVIAVVVVIISVVIAFVVLQRRRQRIENISEEMEI